MNNSVIDQYQYLIIGGTTKAATTSLFNYLATHPEVCVTTMKETRFFIDEDYPVQPHVANWQDGVDKFDKFFSIKESRLRIDATPDYLYSKGTPNRFKNYIPNTKLVFILRDPITRLKSWYKFAKQWDCLPKGITFKEYIDMQLHGDFFEKSKHERLLEKNLNANNIPKSYFLSALEQGRYTKYLNNYLEIFGCDRVKVLFYEDLCKNPKPILQDICDFVDISSECYENYAFKVYNKSQTVKNARLNYYYSALRARVRRYTHDLAIHSVLRRMRLWFDPIFYRFNSCKDEKIEITPEIYQKLENYYNSDIDQLQELLNCKVPWMINNNSEKLFL